MQQIEARFKEITGVRMRKTLQITKPNDIHNADPDDCKTQMAKDEWEKCPVCGRPIHSDIGYCEVCEVDNEEQERKI